MTFDGIAADRVFEGGLAGKMGPKMQLPDNVVVHEPKAAPQKPIFMTPFRYFVLF